MTVTSRAAGDLLTAAIFNTKLESPILTGEIQDGAVTTAKLADSSVTAAKLAGMPAARVYNSAAISISHNLDTVLTFNSECFDTDAIHDTITNPSRLVCKTAGLYLIVGHVRFASNPTGFRYIYIRVNGTTSLGVQETPAVSGVPTILSVATLYQLAVNDYVELVVFQNSGAALNVEVSVAQSPEFALVRVSA